MNTLVNKFCNLLMRSGNKTKALALFSRGFTLFLRSCNTQNTVPTLPKQRKKTTLSYNPKWDVLTPGASLSSASKDAFLEGKSNPHKLFSQQETKLAPLAFSTRLSLPSQTTLTNTGIKVSVTPYLLRQRKNELFFPENLLHTLVENIRPCIEIRKVRVARATYQVPAQISKSKGQSVALRWIIEFANKRKQKDRVSFAEALAQELKLAHNKQGGARQRRGEVHRLAEANRTSMRYRWW